MELQDFLAKVAHDLKAPARQMNSIVQLLSADGDFSEDQLAVVEMLNATAQKGILQIDGLNYFAQSINVGDNRMLMDFNDVVKSVAERYPSLQIDSSDQERFEIEFNLPALKNILNEILSNSLKFSPKTCVPTLLISVQQNAGISPLISFSSKSIGVDFDHPKNLLSPFARDAKANQIEGFGMGLTIVDYLVGQAGGDLCLSQKDEYFVVDWRLNHSRELLAREAA